MLLAHCASPTEGQSYSAFDHQGMCCKLFQDSKFFEAEERMTSSGRELDKATLMGCNMKSATAGNP